MQLPHCVTASQKVENMVNFLRVAPPGNVVEIGVYLGGVIGTLASVAPERSCYGYDTFEGMPTPSPLDNFHKEGDFAVDFTSVQKALAGLKNVVLVKGMYPASDTIKPSPIALAHVDVDIYKCTYAAFCYLSPFMAAGGRIYCDDAFTPFCHGATLSVCEFCYIFSKVPKLDNGNHLYIEY